MKRNEMSYKTQKKKRIFLENPYDIETVFESMSIASSQDKELQYMDQLIARLRLYPESDITEMNYKILENLDLIK